MESLELHKGFPDMAARFYHLRVDPLEPHRVWLTSRCVCVGCVCVWGGGAMYVCGASVRAVDRVLVGCGCWGVGGWPVQHWVRSATQVACGQLAQCMVHGAWCMVHGAWCMVHGAWCMVHGQQKRAIKCKHAATAGVSYWLTQAAALLLLPLALVRPRPATLPPIRPTGTHSGEFSPGRRPWSVKPTGKRVELPPQTSSLSFNEEGQVGGSGDGDGDGGGWGALTAAAGRHVRPPSKGSAEPT